MQARIQTTLPHELLANVLESAKRLQQARPTFAQILEHIDACDIAYAVWEDSTLPNNIGLLLLKGNDILDRIEQDQTSKLCAIGDVRCIEIEQALALQIHLGQRGRH